MRALAGLPLPLSLLTGLALSLLTTTVHAGPVERWSAIALHPGEPNKLALGYENGLGGLFVSSDGGKSFVIRASQSIALTGNAYFPRSGFPLLYVQDALLVAGSAGLLEGDVESCGLHQNAALDGAWAVALAHHPEDPKVAFVVSHGQSAAHAGLYRRSSAGALQALGRSDAADLYVTGLSVVTRAASQQALRFVETVQRVDSQTLLGFVRYSDDLGDTWTEQALPSQAFDESGTLQLLAVDPLSPEAFLVNVSFAGSVESRGQTYLTTDAGRTFARYGVDLADASAATVAPDGRLWLGDRAGGLWFAPRIGMPLVEIQSFGVNCLAYDAAHDDVLICRDNTETGVDELGRLDPKTRAYCQQFQIDEVSGFPDCPGEMLITDPNNTEQLCVNYCNLTHFWYAPVCANYHAEATACGRSVLGTGLDHSMATQGSAARCEDISGAPSKRAGAGDREAAAAAGASRASTPAAGGCSVAIGAPRSAPATSLALLFMVLMVLMASTGRQLARRGTPKPFTGRPGMSHVAGHDVGIGTTTHSPCTRPRGKSVALHAVHKARQPQKPRCSG